MGDMRSRTLVTRIQTMRTSTMVALGTLVVLMVIFYIKDSNYRERVSKETRDRYRKLETDSAAIQKGRKPSEKKIKDEITEVSKNDGDQNTFSSKKVSTTTQIPTSTLENDNGEELEILKYKNPTNGKKHPENIADKDDQNNVNDDRDDDANTTSETPSTTLSSTTSVSNKDSEKKTDDDGDGRKKSNQKMVVKNSAKKIDEGKTEKEKVKTKPGSNDLPEKSEEKIKEQKYEDIQNKKGLIDILGAETKKLQSKGESVNRQIPSHSEKNASVKPLKPLLQMKLPESSVELPEVKNENTDNTVNRVAQPTSTEDLNQKEVKRGIQTAIGDSPKLPKEDTVKRLENKLQESVTPKTADNNDMAAQIKMLALKYSITLNETDLPRQSETYTKRLRNKLIQTGRFDLLESKNCKKRLPKCIIIGVMKAGTEAFSTFIGLHPQIAMQFGYAAMAFFSSSQYENGLEWYRERMMCSTKNQITMEKSPQYFSSPVAPKRIHSMDRNIKLILLVRDPISRALSHFLQQKSSNPDRLRAQTFEECVYNKKTKTVISSSPYIQQSTYSVILKRWLEYFSFKQILIVDGDTFRKNPIRSLHKAEAFLDIDSSISKDRLYFNEEKGFYCLKIDSTSQQDLEMSCLGSEKGRTHPSIDPEVKKALLKYFRPFNKEFMKMSGMDMEWD